MGSQMHSETMQYKENGDSIGSVCNYDPEKFFELESFQSLDYAIIVLNQPILLPHSFLLPFWNRARIRITADGGTNRWFHYIEQNACLNSKPASIDIVSGDFDSVTPENLKKAVESGAKKIYTPDQNETDFTKSLRVLEEERILKNIQFDSIFVICKTSGRMDQSMGNIHTLYKCQQQQIIQPNTSIYLMSDDSLSWVFKSGENILTVPRPLRNSKMAWCGLIPIGEICDGITTTGLKWNLKNGTLGFGILVSSSNKFDGSDTVTIKSDKPFLWCMGILPILHKLYNVPLDEE